jgi:glycosyltransferase involved in cell wall biosynthesis
MKEQPPVAAPTITVLLPHHKCEAFLGAAVRSILRQNFGDFELLVIDDCSDGDGWLSALEPYRHDLRLHAYRTSRNVGPYRIKNAALGMIRSPLVAFQDADDISHPRRFDDELSLMRRTGAHVVGSSFNYISEDGAFIRFKKMVGNANLWLRLGKAFVSHHPTTIVRREVLNTLGGFDGTTAFAGDADFVLRAKHLYRLRNCPAARYDYRLRKTSLSGGVDTGHESALRKKYVSAMHERERARRGEKGSSLLKKLVAPPNDMKFELTRIF